MKIKIALFLLLTLSMSCERVEDFVCDLDEVICHEQDSTDSQTSDDASEGGDEYDEYDEYDDYDWEEDPCEAGREDHCDDYYEDYDDDYTYDACTEGHNDVDGLDWCDNGEEEEEEEEVYEDEDDYNFESDTDGSASPTQVQLPAYQTVVLESGNDIDCFAFTLDEEEIVTATTFDDSQCVEAPGFDSIIALFDGDAVVSNLNGERYAFNDDAFGGRCSDLSVQLPAGDYLLCVGSFGRATGSVELDIQSRPLSAE